MQHATATNCKSSLDEASLEWWDSWESTKGKKSKKQKVSNNWDNDDDQLMDITVTTTVTVRASANIAAVKSEVEKKLGIDCRRQILYGNSSAGILADTQAVKDVGKKVWLDVNPSMPSASSSKIRLLSPVRKGRH